MKTIKKNLTTSAFIITGFLTLFVFQACTQEPSYEKIDEIVLAEAKYDLFSGSVLVAKDGEIIYKKSIGESNKETNDLNIMDTRFNISSVGKCFVATLIMQLNQEGLISLEDPLKKYFPKCPFNSANEIKIKNLLNHTSGLGDYRSHERYQEEVENFKQITDVLPLVFDIPPESGPKEKFNYSNTGYLLLKAIIEKVEKKKFTEVLKHRILDPLEMDNTSFFHSGVLLSNRAFGYSLSAESEYYIREFGEPEAYTGGGIYTTVEDLLKFDQALYGEKLLSKNSKTQMFNVVKPSKHYGYGWLVIRFGGTQVIYHGGSSGGFSSEFRRYPKKGYTIITLSNYEGGAFEISNKIDCMLLGLSYTLTTEVESYMRRGYLFAMKNELDAALKSYISALELYERGNPDNKTAKMIEDEINNLGYFYIGKKDYKNAIKILKINVAYFPESANAYDSLGEAYMKNGDKELAIKNYEKCLELDPRKSNAKKMLAKLKADQN